MSHWSFAASPLLVLAGLLVWAAAGWLCLANWRRRGGRLVGAMEALRFTIVTLLLFTLLRPEWVRVIQHEDEPQVVILADESGSMATRDLVVATNVLSRAEWLEGQRDEPVWEALDEGAEVRWESFGAASETNAAAGTDIDGALKAVLQRASNLKAVLLLSDGGWNAGGSPVGAATRFRDQNVPVFSVAVGRETPLPDLKLKLGSVPAYGLVGEQVALPFRIQSHLPETVEAEIVVANGEQVETRKRIVIPAMTEMSDAVIWSPRSVAEYRLDLRLPVQEGETLADNNEASFRIAVRSETLRVLVVESRPRWEYRFLRNALARDPGVEMHCVLFHPGMSPGDGRHYLPAFPGSKEQLSTYDVVFLGDVGIGQGELRPADAELIRGLVEQQASGLVFLPGSRGRHFSLMETPLADLMPVVLDEQRPEGVGLRNEAALLLTSGGAGHLLTRFDSDENRNAAIWKRLPGFYWSAAVEKSRPGSEVLAVHSALRNNWGRMPLLVTRPHGYGKVLFMGTDSAWRWRRGVEDKYHYRFWSQVVRWMAHQRHLSERQGIRLTYSPETPQTRDTVFLQATVLNRAGFPVEEGPVAGRVEMPSGRAEQLDFEPVEGGWGVFKSRFVPEEGGPHKVTIEAPRQGRKLETEIAVAAPVREVTGQPAHARVLNEIASLTRARSGFIENLDAIVNQMSLLPEPRPRELRLRLWAHPAWGGLLLLLLGVYWTARKWAGMV